MKPQEREDRLIDFAVAVIDVVESLPSTKVGKHILLELVRLLVMDVDLSGGKVEVRGGKGDKDYSRLRRRSAGCMTAPPQPWNCMRR